MGDRFEQIDSLRGLAASSVVLNHLCLASTIPLLTTLSTGYSYSPFFILINGRGAVVLFFILSGFVLSLPFLKGRQAQYNVYLTKRIFRIYIPYLASTILVFILYYLLYKEGLKDVGEWVSTLWGSRLSAGLLLDHFLMLGNYDTRALNTVIWSLIHEMRISIIFPILGFILIKYNWKVILGICIVLSSVSGLNDIFNFETSYGYHTSFSETVHFSSMFLIGGLLAKYHKSLLEIYNKLSRMVKIGLLLVAFLGYTYYGIAQLIFKKLSIPGYGQIGDYSIALAVTLIIITALGSRKVRNILEIKPIKFLGKISYSLYLFHLIVILSLIYWLQGIMSTDIILLISVPVSIGVATVAYHYIELPAIKAGKKLTSRFNKNNRQEQVNNNAI